MMVEVGFAVAVVCCCGFVVMVVAVVGKGQWAWWCKVCSVFFFNGFVVGLWLDICWICGGFGVKVVIEWW